MNFSHYSPTFTFASAAQLCMAEWLATSDTRPKAQEPAHPDRELCVQCICIRIRTQSKHVGPSTVPWAKSVILCRLLQVEGARMHTTSAVAESLRALKLIACATDHDCLCPQEWCGALVQYC